MKILKVYDKINRNTVLVNYSSGDITLKEYTNEGYFYLIINTKIFKSKKSNMAYFSYRKIINHTIREELDLTTKYIQLKQRNEKGLLIYSIRNHVKDIKSFFEVFRLYDDNDEFIEIENHKGNKTMKFKIKEEMLNNFLKLI